MRATGRRVLNLYSSGKRGWSFYIILQDVDDGMPRCNKVTIMATAGAVKRSPLKIYPRLLYTLPLYNRKMSSGFDCNRLFNSLEPSRLSHSDVGDGLFGGLWVTVEGGHAALGACGIGGGSEFRGVGDECPCVCVCAACVHGKLRRPRWASSTTGGGRNRLLARAGVFGDSPAGPSEHVGDTVTTATAHDRHVAATTVGGGNGIRQHHHSRGPRSSRLAAQ
ncbi:Uncharacterized protein FWK35_00001895 [Aphis craccivora]|uniref:Uncharacterized protein n=1 Tax=Aphis craccivora TaxID=307492 RepID=A0A6G0ZJ87_APHCR|nr:Uncharacterized protein FWK35_00001895 [Aphis craccivora]